MADEGSVAPKERVNIVYKTETGGMQETLELPLRLLVMGDFTGRKDPRPVEKREAIEVDKDNLEEVLSSLGIHLDLDVEDVISGKSDARFRVALDVSNFNDFEPDAIARQVPELRQLLELRSSLVELKAPIDENDEFRNRLQALLDDHDQRRSLLDELEVGPAEEKK
jgi:type VI secretion system protein ImpB